MEIKINNNGEMLDATIEMVDGVMVVSPKEVKFEPKDGDVVYVDTGNKNIIIYREQQNKVGRYVNYFDEQYLYIDTCDFCGSIHDIIEIRPATEEEKKELFAKLAEEGYEWKADTKELIKLKWKPTYGTLYYRPGIRRAEINVISDGWADNDMDKSYYDKGWIFKTHEECDAFCNKLRQAIEGVKP